MSRTRVDRRALADAIPLFLPAIPFGFVLGLAVTEGEMPIAIGWSTSIFIFAGAAQLAVITLAGTARLWAVIVAGLVINTRHVMYSAALAPTFQQQPTMDAMARTVHAHRPGVRTRRCSSPTGPPAEFRRYYLTVGLFFFVNWQWATALGMIVGPVVPESWQLGFAPADHVPRARADRHQQAPQAVAALVGGLVGLATAGLQDRLGILVGADRRCHCRHVRRTPDGSGRMSAWSAILIVVIVGLMTYSMRAVVIVAMANRTIPPSVARALRSVGPAVLAALAVNLAVGGEGRSESRCRRGSSRSSSPASLRGGSKNLIVTLIAGMTTLWLAHVAALRARCRTDNVGIRGVGSAA